MDPAKRLTVEECIQSKLFDDIRAPTMEADSDIIVSIESDTIDAFDYSKMVDNKFPRRKHYMELILKEIELINEKHENDL